MRGLRWPGFSLIVPRVAMLTTEGDVRLTMGASDGTGESATGVAGSAAKPMGAASTAAASVAAASVSRKFMRGPYLSDSAEEPQAPRVKAASSRYHNGWPNSYTFGVGRFIVRPHAIGYTATVLRGSAALDPRYYTEARARGRCPRSHRLLGRLNRNSLRLHLRQFRNCAFQYPVGGLRLDVLGVHRIRKAEATQELSGYPLDAAISLGVLAPGLFALTANRQHSMLGGDLDSLGIHARQVHVQNELLCFFVDVDRRQPRARIGRSGLGRAEQAMHILLKPIDERPWLITYDGHLSYSYN